MGCSVGVDVGVRKQLSETLGRDRLSGHSGVVLIVVE